jgi:hypothetical protein
MAVSNSSRNLTASDFESLKRSSSLKCDKLTRDASCGVEVRFLRSRLLFFRTSHLFSTALWLLCEWRSVDADGGSAAVCWSEVCESNAIRGDVGVCRLFLIVSSIGRWTNLKRVFRERYTSLTLTYTWLLSSEVGVVELAELGISSKCLKHILTGSSNINGLTSNSLESIFTNKKEMHAG